ncbi:hypothetical protein F1C16_22055 (plasmid) [Hymenobacter sp. NBH84]|uniref:hypothetical protein n=1 Tax=Hymenobacter sp. NBH84 TaxID=2596915 RepID=UPI0016264E61|nr:hypothetical protein [Hymenobacter sp. NBH84]QNE42310.1 hypothetical protein F1C16_22055 [Hymenobacter sp. NBH84]
MVTTLEFPTFNAALGVNYEEGLRLVRGHLRSYGSAELPTLLAQCSELGQSVDEAALHSLYFGPSAKPKPALIRTLLGVFGYNAQQIEFEMGPVTGRRHFFFLDTEADLSKFKAELAAFDALPN